MADAKTIRQQQASRRAEILEGISDEKRALYRERKTHVNFQHSWLPFFQNSKAESVKEMVCAILEYDSLGKVPEFKDGYNTLSFMSFIRPVLDNAFDEWCFTCRNSEIGGKQGGRMRIIRTMFNEKYKERHGGRDSISGIKVTEYLSNVNDSTKFRNALLKAGVGVPDVSNLIKELQALHKECEAQYDENHPDTDD